jgi:transcriptional regulator with XRE-family HTH domain
MATRSHQQLLTRHLGLPIGTVDAHSFVRQSIGADLRAAREHAKLRQAELAERMGKSQTMVSQAESGTARVSERYLRAVLKACGLPEDWSGPKSVKPRKRARKVA